MSVIGWAWGVVFLALVGCGSPPAPENAQPLTLSLGPGSLGRSLSLSQAVTGEYEDRTIKMRFEVEITPERLVVVGLSPLGLTLFTLEQSKGETKVTMYANKGKAFDPRFMLIDLYLTFWPVKTLQAALSAKGLSLQEDLNGRYRRVFGRDGRKLVEVNYPARIARRKETVITHYDFPYRLRIVTLEERPTS